MKSKILVLYPDPESLDKVIEKANFQNTKNGPFEAVLLLGAHISELPPTKPAVPTYFCGEAPNSENEDAVVDVAENFVRIQRPWAAVKLESGITVGFLNKSAPSETPGEVDILVSYHWAYSVARTQKLALVGNKAVDDVVRSCRPRYHFAVGTEQGRFYEHSVFAWRATRTCRFISLAQEGSGNKWFYAFSIDTSDDDATGAGTSPFSEKREREAESEQNAGKKSENSEKLQRLSSINPHDEPAAKRPRIVSPSECYFCLSNPKLEAHMIIAIGKHSYLTVAKGPLTRPNKNRGFSGHAIIIPIDHTAQLPVPIGESEPFKEIAQFQRALAQAFSTLSQATVFFEISRPENVHFHVQMVPVPMENAQSLFENALEDRTRTNNERFERNLHLEFGKYQSEPDMEKALAESQEGYVKFSLHTENKVVHYVALISGEKALDLQFPRRVLAYLLRIPKRIHWDRCKQTVAQESDDCEKFKQFFKEYDFTQGE